MKKDTRPILISIKPEYADMVFMGLKTAELRRKVSQKLRNRDVYVYSSSPVKQLRGGFRVGEIWSDSPENIWQMVSGLAGVDRETFDEYYQGSNVAYALEIREVWEYEVPLSLDVLRSKFEEFVAPQSYRFLTSKEIRSIPRLKKKSYASIAI